MYLIDTNVLSELRRKSPIVLRWMRETELLHLYCSVISIGEIEKGVERRRRSDPEFAHHLSKWRDDLRAEYQDRTLTVTTEVALTWGRITAGRTRDTADALIAATALVHDLTLVTRNVKDFSDLPIAIVNPWDA